MISYIRGEVIDKNDSSVVIDVNGIGYEVFVPNRVLGSIDRSTGPVELYTYLQVKEDGLSLFGFTSKQDLRTFKLLITVSGIGPKGALSILSNTSTENLILYVVSEDVKAISKLPGIGAKTAGKLVLELKDKFSLSDTLKVDQAILTPDKADFREESALASAARDEAIAALVSLGYSASESVKAVRSVQNAEEMTSEQLLKASLKLIL